MDLCGFRQFQVQASTLPVIVIVFDKQIVYGTSPLKMCTKHFQEGLRYVICWYCDAMMRRMRRVGIHRIEHLFENVILCEPEPHAQT